MRERINLSLSPTGSNPAGTARITPELVAFHRYRAHVLRAETIACFARGVWRWLTRQAAAANIGNCAERDWLGTAVRG